MAEPDPPPPNPKKRKSKSKSNSKSSTIFSSTTIRHFPFTYFHLVLVSASALTMAATAKLPPIDLLTVRTHLTSALTRFLGTTGAAIPVDILRVDGRDAWVRVPYQDGRAVTEALAGWMGNEVAWKVRESGCWVGGLVGSNGHDLFDD